MPLDQRSILGETPVTHWLSALYRGAGRGRQVVPRTEVPIIDEVVPLKDGAAAQARLAEGKQFGKIVLTP